MVTQVYYFGWETGAGMGYEWVSSDSAISYASAAACTDEISWIRGATVAVDENVTREYFIGSSSKRDADDTLKGIHETTGTLTWWLPNDISVVSNNVANDIYMLKLPFDGLVSHNATSSTWSVPSASHGSHILHPFSLELGHNKIGTNLTRYLKTSGCVASSFTMRARAGENIECSMDWQGKGCQWLSGGDATSGGMAATTRSTEPPLNFGHCSATIASTQLTECTGFEFTIDNNLIPNYALASQGSRVLSELIPGKRDITGTLTLNMASGNITNDLFGYILASAGGTVPADAPSNNVLSLTVAGVSGSFAVGFTNVVFGDLSMDIDPTKVQEISLPWGAEQADLTIWTIHSATIPTNWNAV